MLDRIDKKILRCLQENSQLTNQELAEKVSLSPSPCLRRVKQLQADGYISQQVALLNPKKLGLNLNIFVLVGLAEHSPKKMKNFEAIMMGLDTVLHCSLITGQSADYLLQVIVKDMDAYHAFLLDTLTQIDGVSHIHSSFVLRTIVNRTALPID